MRINYFSYCIKSTATDQKTLYDIRDFLKTYCKHADPKIKNNFRHNDEHIYLIHLTDDTFLFLMTRSKELIRKVNTNDISVGEINSLLEKGEQLGFASYIHVKEAYFGFGSTLLAPKIDVFANYINNLFEALGIPHWVFLPQPLLYQATKNEALALPYVGRTTIELARQNTLLQDFLATMSVDTSDTDELESIEIIIKPKLKKNIKSLVTKFLTSIPDEGVEKLVTRARSEASSQMMDLYLVGRGAISDAIDKTKENQIPNQIEEKMNANSHLQTKLTEYITNESFEENSLDAIVRFTNASAWTDYLSTIESDTTVLN